MKCLLADFQLRAHRLDRGTLVELGFRPDQLARSPAACVAASSLSPPALLG
jgi:hypothetical protein